MTIYIWASLVVALTGATLIYFKKTAYAGWLCLPAYFIIQALEIKNESKDLYTLILVVVALIALFVYAILRKKTP